MVDHKTNEGSTWIDTKSQWKISGNKLYFAGSQPPTGALTYVNAKTPNAVIQVTINWATFGVNSQQGIAARIVDENNFWVLRGIPNQNFKLVECVNGNFTDRASSGFQPRNYETNTIKLRLQGDTLIGFVDGTEYLRYTSTSFNQATKHGLWGMEYYGDTQARWDDFSITPI